MGKKTEKHIIVAEQTKLRFDRAKAEHAEAQDQSVTQDEYIRHLLSLTDLAARLAAELCALVEAFDIGILHADLRENAQAALASFEAAQEPTP